MPRPHTQAVEAQPRPISLLIRITVPKSYSKPPKRSGCKMRKMPVWRIAAIVSGAMDRRFSPASAASRTMGISARVRSTNSSRDIFAVLLAGLSMCDLSWLASGFSNHSEMLSTQLAIDSSRSSSQRGPMS